MMVQFERIGELNFGLQYRCQEMSTLVTHIVTVLQLVYSQEIDAAATNTTSIVCVVFHRSYFMIS